MLDKEQLEHLYNAMNDARTAIYTAKETVSSIPDSTVAMPIMAALQQQMDTLSTQAEPIRLQLIALSQR